MLSQMAGFPSFAWLDNNIPLYVYVCVCMYHVFFFHPFDWHLGCVHILGIVNNASVNMGLMIDCELEN